MRCSPPRSRPHGPGFPRLPCRPPKGGTLVTLELEPDRARIARENVDRAGCGGAVEIMVGPAMRSLESMRAAGAPPFDLVFIDADKENCPGYLEHALALSRPGMLIVVDNAIRRGRLIDPGTGDPSVDGVRVMMDAIGRHPRLRAAGIQTVGAKGYDGLVLALVGDVTREAADPLDVMLRHDAWATREVLRACAGLTTEQWTRRFIIGPGSLHDALTHVVGAMLVHVTTHGAHHRAQCLNMLRLLGLPGVSDRLPEIDALDWDMQAKAAPKGPPAPSPGARRGLSALDPARSTHSTASPGPAPSSPSPPPRPAVPSRRASPAAPARTPGPSRCARAAPCRP